MYPKRLDPECCQSLSNIKAFVSSTSGVLNNNQDLIGVSRGWVRLMVDLPLGGFLRSHYDGQGVSLLRAIGINIAFVHVDIYDEDDPVSKLVTRWNTLPSAVKPGENGGWPPVKLINGVVGDEQIQPVQEWLEDLGLTFSNCAVMGHDLVQIPLLRRASFKVAPAQAEKVVQDMVDWVTPRPGGNGALRDFANLVLEVRKIDPTTLPTR